MSLFRSPVRGRTPTEPPDDILFSDDMMALHYSAEKDRTFTTYSPTEQPSGLKKEVEALIAVIRDAVGRSGNIKRDIKSEILSSADKILLLVQSNPSHQSASPVNTEEIKTTIRECIKEEFKTIKVPAPIIRAPPPPPSPAGQLSYAKVTSLPSVASTQLRPPPYKPAIIVSSKNSTSPSDTLSAWQKSISFRDTNFAPETVKPISNNKIRVEFNKAEHLEITMSKVNASTGIEAEPSKKLQPMLQLKGISQSVPSEILTDILRRQNDCIKNNGPDDFQLKFKRGNRNPKLYNAFFTATPALWRSIIEAGKLNVDHQRVHVEEHVPVLQCFRCLQYGHTRKWCKESTSTCSHCASTEHAFKDCPTKNDSSKTCCFNCSAHNKKRNIIGKDAHSATSVTCPRYINMMNVIRARTDYGE